MKTISTILMTLIVCFVSAQTNTFPSAGAAGIGTTTPDASSLLEVKSTSKGVLIPRMTKAQRDGITSPATGLLIYQTNNTPGFYYYNGTAWTSITSKAANTSLSNLKSPTSVSADLVPSLNTTYNLGSNTVKWNTAYLKYIVFDNDGTLQTTAFVPYVAGDGINISGNIISAANNQWSSNGPNIYYNSGNVGVGTSSPSSKLQITHNSSLTNAQLLLYENENDYARLNFQNSTGTSYWTIAGLNSTTNANERFNFYNSTTGDVMSLTGDRKVGIGGSSSNGYTLNVNSNNVGGINITDPVDSTALNITKSGTGSAINITSSGDNNSLNINKSGFGNGIFVNSIQAAVIALSQNDRAVIAQSTSSDAIYGYAGQFGSGIRAKSELSYGLYATTTSGAYAGYFGGNVFCNGMYASSDIKLKQNIKDVSSAMDIINQLHPKLYTFRQDGNYALMHLPKGEHYGLIAQELEKVLPNLVKDSKFETRLESLPSENSENEKSETIEFKAVNYTELIPVLIKAVQEQQQQIDELKQTIQTLKSVNKSFSNSTTMHADDASLQQNIPNPFNRTTTINYTLPQKYSSAKIVVVDKSGKILKEVDVSVKGKGSLNIETSALSAGAYQYSLYVDGKLIDTKQMLLQK